jgi:hypothetical protein
VRICLQISIDEWLSVVDILLAIDDLVSKKLAWGNLVIKIAICNKIFYWMFDYVDTHEGMIKDEILDNFLLIQKKTQITLPIKYLHAIYRNASLW